MSRAERCFHGCLFFKQTRIQAIHQATSASVGLFKVAVHGSGMAGTSTPRACMHPAPKCPPRCVPACAGMLAWGKPGNMPSCSALWPVGRFNSSVLGQCAPAGQWGQPALGGGAWASAMQGQPWKEAGGVSPAAFVVGPVAIAMVWAPRFFFPGRTNH